MAHHNNTPQSIRDAPSRTVSEVVTYRSPNRQNRRHVKPERFGKTFYVPKDQQRPSRNVPFVKATS